jgi:hypothetical protein
MLVDMARYSASQACGRGKNSDRLHASKSSFFFQVCELILGMRCVVIVIRVITSAREKSGAVVGKNEG